ncbi:hypothetical protein BH11CYA1_BH11CYA1_23560 [soil metagenome]
MIQAVLIWLFQVFCVAAMPILAYQFFVNGLYVGAALYAGLSLLFFYSFAASIIACPAMWQAASLIKAQRHRQAESILVSVLQLWKRMPCRKDWTFYTLQSNLALTYMASGQYHKAENLYGEIIEHIEKNTNQARHPLAAVYLNNLAMVYLHQGEFIGAEKLANRALEIWSAAKPSEQAGRAYPLANLLEVHLSNDDLEACERDADLGLLLSTQEQQPIYIIPESRIGVYVQCLLYKAIVCFRQGRLEEAKQLSAAILNGHDQGLYPTFGYSIPGLNYLACEFMAVGDNQNAERFLEMAYEILKAHPFHGDGPLLIGTYETLLLATDRASEVADLKNWVRPCRLMLQG